MKKVSCSLTQDVVTALRRSHFGGVVRMKITLSRELSRSLAVKGRELEYLGRKCG